MGTTKRSVKCLGSCQCGGSMDADLCMAKRSCKLCNPNELASIAELLDQVDRSVDTARFTSDQLIYIRDVTDLQGLQGVVNRLVGQETNYQSVIPTNNISEYDMWLICHYATRFFRKNVGREFVDDTVR